MSVYKDTIDDCDLMDVGGHDLLIEKGNSLLKNSGAGNVLGGKLSYHENIYTFRTEIEVYFDSSTWTGLPTGGIQ